jgi:hypothetical protein
VICPRCGTENGVRPRAPLITRCRTGFHRVAQHREVLLQLACLRRFRLDEHGAETDVRFTSASRSGTLTSRWMGSSIVGDFRIRLKKRSGPSPCEAVGHRSGRPHSREPLPRTRRRRVCRTRATFRPRWRSLTRRLAHRELECLLPSHRLTFFVESRSPSFAEPLTSGAEVALAPRLEDTRPGRDA